LPFLFYILRVPGHEITGYVESIGAGVTKFKVGDVVGVGVFVDRFFVCSVIINNFHHNNYSLQSCRNCKQCQTGAEIYCKESCVFTYNDRYKYPHTGEFFAENGGAAPTYGGYSQKVLFIIIN
jgi:uncharacterized zinc-type alcohol dehydrogenase-like protein